MEEEAFGTCLDCMMPWVQVIAWLDYKFLHSSCLCDSEDWDSLL